MTPLLRSTSVVSARAKSGETTRAATITSRTASQTRKQALSRISTRAQVTPSRVTAQTTAVPTIITTAPSGQISPRSVRAHSAMYCEVLLTTNGASSTPQPDRVERDDRARGHATASSRSVVRRSARRESTIPAQTMSP